MTEFVGVTNLSTPSESWFVRRKEVIAASVTRVWRALTVRHELQSWWCDEARVELRPGGLYAFGGPHTFFGARTGKEPPTPPGNFEIIELEENERLTYRWWLGGLETRVTYELAGVLESTELTVTQAASESPFARWPFTTARGDNETPNWWWVFLPNLRAHLEAGRPALRLNYEEAQGATKTGIKLAFSTFAWVVWNKLTEPQELDRWWAKGATIDPSPGGTFSLGLDGPGPRHILEFEPETRLVHDWWWNDEVSTRIEWTIEETDGDTQVSVTDITPWDPGTQGALAPIFWSAMLFSLKEMSERGISPRDHHAG